MQEEDDDEESGDDIEWDRDNNFAVLLVGWPERLLPQHFAYISPIIEI